MHLISFNASPRQISKLRNGHKVRIKKGTGFNLVVHPENYKLVSRAFTRNKGTELKLSPEELELNKSLSPEQHNELGNNINKSLFKHLPMSEGGSIFKHIKRALNSKTGKKITGELKRVGKEIAHEKIDELHKMGKEKYGHNQHLANLMDTASDMAHSKLNGGSLKSIGRQIKRAFNSKAGKKITGVLKDTAKEYAHQKIADLHSMGADKYGSDPRLAGLMNMGANMAHEKISGFGLGGGLYAGRGMNAHEALKLANMATAHANHQLAKMHNATVHGQITQPPIKRYWDEPMAPPSRGTGITNHYNMIRGRGSMISQDHILPPALQSQPYGVNFHMQFQLPPQYHKYNDGSDVEGRGLYI